MNGSAITRPAIRLIAMAGVVLLLAAGHHPWQLDHQDLTAQKLMPPLQFTLTDASTGKVVSAAEFRGKIVMLYFGYTNCPNVCPLTLSDTAQMFRMIGKEADDIRFLFVTVDPRRDTLPILRKYAALYGSPDIIGMRGSDAELHNVAARYHAAYSVHPSPDPKKYTVSHTSAIYVFNRQGKPEFIIAGLASGSPDLKGIARDLKHLVTADAI